MEPDEPPLMPIGMFSRATLLSVKQLRRYHEQGILVPTAVDPVTGYRMYDVSQVHDAGVLSRLRSLDLPMTQVARILTARDPEVTRAVLGDHDRALRTRRDELECAIVALQQAMAIPSGHTPTHLREHAALQTLQITDHLAGDDIAAFLDKAFDELMACAAEHGYTVTGPSCATYPPEVTEIEEVTALIPVTVGPGGPDDGFVSGRVRTGRLDQALCAVAVHAGSYDSFADTYGQLGAWVASHATSAGMRILERYVVDPCQVSDPSELRTEIWWPILATPTKEEK